MPHHPDGDLASRLKARLATQSLRDLAQELGVSHVSVWKAASGGSLRAKTRQAMEEALARLDGTDLKLAVEQIRRRVVRDLGSERAGTLAKAIERAIEAAYRGARHG